MIFTGIIIKPITEEQFPKDDSFIISCIDGIARAAPTTG